MKVLNGIMVYNYNYAFPFQFSSQLSMRNFYPTLVVSKSHLEIDNHQLLFLDPTLEFNINIDYQIL